MNRANALTWLGRATASTSEPPLSTPELELLLDTFAPGVTDYTLPQLNRCAAEGWDWKASAAAEGHGKESDIYEHCVERRAHYARRAGGGGAVVKAGDSDSVKALLQMDRVRLRARQLDRERIRRHGSAAVLTLTHTDGEAILPAGWDLKDSETSGRFTFLVVPPDSEFSALLKGVSRPRLKMTGSSNAALNDVEFRLTGETRPPVGEEAAWRLEVEQTEA